MAHQDYEEDDDRYVVIERHTGSTKSLLIGLAVGAGLALLFAPASGEETRRQLRMRAQKVRRAAQDAVTEAKDTVVGVVEDARARVEEQVDAARQAIELKKRQVVRAVDAGREAAEQAREELEQRLADTKAAYQSGARKG